MLNAKVIDVDEDNLEFLDELKRRLNLAKNPKNRISLSIAKKDILKKYQKPRRFRYGKSTSSRRHSHKDMDR